MKLPTRLRVGRRKYDVRLVPSLGFKRGRVDLTDRKIDVAMRCGVLHTAFPPKERAEVFWHEVTHAILHDMKHPLWRSEKFVQAFAKRLNDSIHSAEFE